MKNLILTLTILIASLLASPSLAQQYPQHGPWYRINPQGQWEIWFDSSYWTNLYVFGQGPYPNYHSFHWGSAIEPTGWKLIGFTPIASSQCRIVDDTSHLLNGKIYCWKNSDLDSQLDYYDDL